MAACWWRRLFVSFYFRINEQTKLCECLFQPQCVMLRVSVCGGLYKMAGAGWRHNEGSRHRVVQRKHEEDYVCCCWVLFVCVCQSSRRQFGFFDPGRTIQTLTGCVHVLSVCVCTCSLCVCTCSVCTCSVCTCGGSSLNHFQEILMKHLFNIT